MQSNGLNEVCVFADVFWWDEFALAGDGGANVGPETGEVRGVKGVAG